MQELIINSDGVYKQIALVENGMKIKKSKNKKQKILELYIFLN